MNHKILGLLTGRSFIVVNTQLNLNHKVTYLSETMCEIDSVHATKNFVSIERETIFLLNTNSINHWAFTFASETRFAYSEINFKIPLINHKN